MRKDKDYSNNSIRRDNLKNDTDIRFDRAVRDNSRRRMEEEEEHIRAMLVRDIEEQNRQQKTEIQEEDYYIDPLDDEYLNREFDRGHYSQYDDDYQNREYNRDSVRQYNDEHPQEFNEEYHNENFNTQQEELSPSEIRKLKRKEKREEKRRRNVNKPFSRVTYLFVFIFLGLMAYIVYFNIVEAPDVINSPYNTRADVYKEQVIKGKILSSNGEVLAESVSDDGVNYYRRYPYGSIFSHIVGYDINGKAGLEASENLSMLTSHAFFIERIANEFKESRNTGDNIVTTLDPELQSAAWNALGDNKGAVVAIEPSTGKILAMVSKPDYDPNSLWETWDYLNTDEVNSPLLNRATYGMYPPGSVFKIVTTLEYIRENSDYSSYSYECSGSITEGETTISCFDGTVHGSEDLSDSFAYSCNSSFSNIGIGLDGTSWANTAKELLFNSEIPGRLNAAKTSFKVTGDSGYATRMMTAMGQGETLTNPYHMALIASAVANGGTLMTPYIVDRIENYSSTVVKSYGPKTYGQLMTTEEAGILAELMKGVVSYGTAYELSDEGYSVAGKTGTAEYSDDKNKAHSWFVGYSNVDNPDLVVSVIVECYDGNPYSRSIPIAQAVFDAYHY